MQISIMKSCLQILPSGALSRLAALLLAASSVGDCLASSTLYTSISASAPTDSWLSSGLQQTTTDQWFNNSGTSYRYWAQQFMAPSEAVLDTVSIKLSAGSASSASEAPISFTIKSYSASTLGTWTGASTVATLTTSLPSSPTPSSWQNQWLTFSFEGDPITLQQGVVYSFQFNFANQVSGGPKLYTYFGSRETGVTSGVYRYGNDGTYSLSTQALGMIISTTAIPEPASVTLFLGSGALLFTMFGRRRRSIPALDIHKA